MPTQQDYLFQYEDSYSSRREAGWAICDENLKKRFATPAQRKGRTLLECLRAAQARGEKVFLCKDYPENIRDIVFTYKKPRDVNLNAAFVEQFNKALLILSQLDFSREMLSRAIDDGALFAFDSRMKENNLAYVFNKKIMGENVFNVVFNKGCSSPFELAKVIVHELHHREQNFRDIDEPNFDEDQVWDLQSYVFLNRVFEAEALVVETYFLYQMRQNDFRGLLASFPICDEQRDKDVLAVFRNSKTRKQSYLFAEAFVAAFPSISYYYDKDILKQTRDLIECDMRSKKNKALDVFTINRDNLKEEITSRLSVAGIPFGHALSRMGIDLLHPNFFGFDKYFITLKYFQRKAGKLNPHFNRKSFNAVPRNERRFKNFMKKFLSPYQK